LVHGGRQWPLVEAPKNGKTKQKGSVCECVCVLGALAMHIWRQAPKTPKKNVKKTKNLKGHAYCHYKEGRKEKKKL
jgi:hypothetical protein